MQPDKYLLPQDDGLYTRPSKDYAHYKWKALATYLQIANTAMRDKPWIERYYIDLQAGPGKNQIGNEVFLGSPLIALTSQHAPTQFRFNEYKPSNKTALDLRTSVSPLHNRVKIYQEDANVIVDRICEELIEQDKKARSLKRWSTFNIAFLDPEGLELHWATIEKLASIKKMDLIINFSTSGIVRTIGSKNDKLLDAYFGTNEWRDVDKQFSTNKVERRRVLIDFYRKRLEKFGYHIEIDPSFGGDDIAINNSKNAQVYSLIFASKSELGDKFWKQAAKNAKQPRFPGW